MTNRRRGTRSSSFLTPKGLHKGTTTQNMASLSAERPQIFADGGGDYLGPKSVAHLIPHTLATKAGKQKEST